VAALAGLWVAAWWLGAMLALAWPWLAACVSAASGRGDLSVQGEPTGEQAMAFRASGRAFAACFARWAVLVGRELGAEGPS